MLRSLYIKNYALIDEVTIEWQRGLNIITGETGAGKSIVLGAFGLLMGDRASAEVVRRGTEKAIVEAEFEIEGNPKLAEWLRRQEIEVEQDLLIVRREVLARGTGRGFINDTPATSQLLKELAGYLVDLHGQHEHQSLLRTESHILLLDDHAAAHELLRRYQLARQAFLAKRVELDELINRQSKLQEERDLYTFQLNEIDTIAPKEGEDAKIEQEIRILEHAEELRTAANELHDSLYDAEGSAYEKLSAARDRIKQLALVDASLAVHLGDLTAAVETVSDLSKFLSHYGSAIEFEPGALETLRLRSLAIGKLKRKYGGTLEAVLSRAEQLRGSLLEDEELSEVIERTTRELRQLQQASSKSAVALSALRKRSAEQLAPQVELALKDLGIAYSKFEVRFSQRSLGIESSETSPVVVASEPISAGPLGIDFVEFFLSMNLGEEPKPLAKIASGGEISRIMLALKSLLAKADRLPLMIFDEIDVGVSGRVALKVGRAMKALAEEHQIIAITHLSQIAAFADSHFLVEKKVENKSTSSKLRQLSTDEHIEEIARLMAGEDVSESSLSAARALISEARAASNGQPGKAKRVKN